MNVTPPPIPIPRKVKINKELTIFSKQRFLIWCCVLTSVLFLLTLSWIYSEVFFPQEYIGQLVVGVIAAKEATYIEEWLAHHFYYGVDKIVIFDDNKPWDMEEKTEMKRICSLFGDKCEIIDFNMYDDVACIMINSYLCSSWFMPTAEGTSYSVFAPTRRQGMAMKEFYYFNDNYRKYRWVMMFDVDEFMVTKDVNTQITDILKMLPSDVHAMRVPRYTIGTDNHTTRPEGGVRQNYCWREKKVINSKGMARASEVMLPGFSNHFYATRSMASYEGLTSQPKFLGIDTYSAELGPKSRVLELPGDVKGVTKFNHFYIDPSALVLNHYLTKSKEEHVERRSRASLNYLFKLKEVYHDDKTALGRYNREVCDKQKLSLLPPLMTAEDLERAVELRRHAAATTTTTIVATATSATIAATATSPTARKNSTTGSGSGSGSEYYHGDGDGDGNGDGEGGGGGPEGQTMEHMHDGHLRKHHGQRQKRRQKQKPVLRQRQQY